MKVLTKSLVLIILFSSTISYAQTKNFLDQPYLETSATVDTLAVPDRIYLNIFLSEKDTKDRTSVEELENRMLVKLKSLGIDTDKQLALADFATDFKNYFLRKTGIIKSKAYTLVVYDGLTAGRVIQSLESAGIANINYNRSELSNIEELKLQLRSKAVAKAMQQARSMLQPLEQDLGKAIYIADQQTGFRSSRALYEVSMAKSDAVQPIDVDFQKIRVGMTVNVKFIIE